ncbi:MAG: DUF2752 domain-containing protein [Fimbriiglobus sp.]
MKPNDPPDFEILPDDMIDDWNGARSIPVATVVRGARQRRLDRTVRGMLILMALGFSVVLGLAAWINPYSPTGEAKNMATHTQLGLPPCNMVELTGKPCPACGMTTSFALFMKADLWNSAKANWVGMLLAGFCFFSVPWAIGSAVRGRYFFIGSMERTSTIVVVVLLVLMFSRWGVVLLQ